MTAGRGIAHSARNAATRSERTRARVVQMWVAPDADDLDPSYAERDFTETLATGVLFVAASGLDRDRGSDAVSLANRFAALHIGAPRAGTTIDLPAAPFGHLYVARGTTRLGDDLLTEGDAVRFTGAPAQKLLAEQDCEVLFWEMHASFDR